MQVHQYDEYGTITLPEVLDLHCNQQFKQALQSLYDQDYKTIEVDCNRLTMICTAGIGSLVFFQKKLNERGGELKIVRVQNDNIKYLFERIDLGRFICIE